MALMLTYCTFSFSCPFSCNENNIQERNPTELHSSDCGQPKVKHTEVVWSDHPPLSIPGVLLTAHQRQPVFWVVLVVLGHPLQENPGTVIFSTQVHSRTTLGRSFGSCWHSISTTQTLVVISTPIVLTSEFDESKVPYFRNEVTPSKTAFVLEIIINMKMLMWNWNLCHDQ